MTLTEAMLEHDFHKACMLFFYLHSTNGFSFAPLLRFLFEYRFLRSSVSVDAYLLKTLNLEYKEVIFNLIE